MRKLSVKLKLFDSGKIKIKLSDESFHIIYQDSLSLIYLSDFNSIQNLRK